jgi:hypothetical protein
MLIGTATNLKRIRIHTGPTCTIVMVIEHKFFEEHNDFDRRHPPTYCFLPLVDVTIHQVGVSEDNISAELIL